MGLWTCKRNLLELIPWDIEELCIQSRNRHNRFSYKRIKQKYSYKLTQVYLRSLNTLFMEISTNSDMDFIFQFQVELFMFSNYKKSHVYEILDYFNPS